jgi:hypothetical protein
VQLAGPRTGYQAQQVPQAHYGAQGPNGYTTIAPPVAAEQVVFDGQPRELAFQAPEGVYVDAASGSKRKKAAGIVAAFVLLTGGGATAMALRAASSGGGAATPDKAVRAMIESVSKGDLLGAVDTFPASERTLARDLVEEWAAQAKRLGGVTGDAPLDKFDGYNLDITGLQTSEEPVVDNVVNVRLTEGKVRFSTGAIRTQSEEDAAFPIFGSSSGKPLSANTDIATMDDAVIVTTVHDGEGWHPSLIFSAFDASRRSSDKPKPTAADAIKATGSATPEAAVTDMLNALGSQDYVKVIELLPPGEFAAAHLYGRGLVPETDPDDAAYESTYTFSNLSFDVSDTKGGKKLVPTKASIHEKPGADSDDLATDVTLTKTSPTCVTIEKRDQYDEETKTQCTSVIRDGWAAGSDISDAMLDVVDRLAVQLAKLGFVVVQEQGKWFVSPIRTYSDVASTFVSALKQEDFKTISDFIVGSLFGGGDDYSDDDYPNEDPSYPVEPVTAQNSLSIFVTDAKAIYGDSGSYAGADAKGLAVYEEGYVVLEGTARSTGPDEVSVLVSDGRWTAAALSNNGVCYFISDSDAEGTSFTSSTDVPCSASSMPPATGSIWPPE